ncbi:MAG: S1 family peptidase [Lachnospiraceae bacterium]|nr:S1 family peptidase [Lachnospiraceae bacterium]
MRFRRNVLRIIVMCLIFTFMQQEIIIIQAQDKSNAELLKQRIEQSKESQRENSLEVLEDEIEINNDYKEVQKIVTKNTKNGKKYIEYYGGAYMTDEGQLVVQTVDASTSEQNNILNNTSDHVVIKMVENTYNDLQETYKEISKKFQDYVENLQNIDNKELKALTDNMLGVSIDQERNAIVVDLESVTEEAKALFKKYYGYNDVIFEKGEKDIEEATLLKLGRAIYNSEHYRGSIGMKAYYINSAGEKVKGFVTAAHLVDNVGDSIYIDSAANTKIGKVTKRKYKDNMDAAFIKVTNDNYAPSRKVYYADSKGTVSDRYVLNEGYLSETYVGATIYKSGSTTYLTKGKIISTDKTVKSTDIDVVLTDLWQADYVCAGGDSGGAVFDTDMGYYIAGIVRGSIGTSTKWENIVNTWNLEIY